jgi:hypothetical protein
MIRDAEVAEARLFLTYARVLVEMLHTLPYRARAFESVDWRAWQRICLHKERRKKYKSYFAEWRRRRRNAMAVEMALNMRTWNGSPCPSLRRIGRREVKTG